MGELSRPIIATQYYKPSALIPALRTLLENAYDFQDEHLYCDVRRREMVLTSGAEKTVVGAIHPSNRSKALSAFCGTITVGDFELMKSKRDLLSPLTGVYNLQVFHVNGKVLYEGLLTRFDCVTNFKIPEVLTLRLELVHELLSYRVVGSCNPEFKELAQVLASIILAHSDSSDNGCGP